MLFDDNGAKRLLPPCNRSHQDMDPFLGSCRCQATSPLSEISYIENVKRIPIKGESLSKTMTRGRTGRVLLSGETENVAYLMGAKFY